MSYVSQQFLSIDCSTLATFKAWGSAASAALGLSGWTQTADTGQVDWTTIAALPALGSTVYEIWQPVSDPLQTGSTAYYLKVFYGRSGSGSPLYSQQVGFATNGAGSFVGNTAAPAGQGSFSNATGIFECNFCGDIDRFVVSMWRKGSYPWCWCVERTKNTDGTNSTDGVFVLGNISENTLVFSSASASGTQHGIISPTPSGGTSLREFNNNIPLCPILPMYGVIGNPITSFCMIPASDIADGGVFTTTLYGQTRRYLTLGLTGGNLSWNGQALAMRYD